MRTASNASTRFAYIERSDAGRLLELANWSTQASLRIHLWVFEQAGQRNGIARFSGMLSKMTCSVVNPVGTDFPRIGQRTMIFGMQRKVGALRRGFIAPARRGADRGLAGSLGLVARSANRYEIWLPVGANQSRCPTPLGECTYSIGSDASCYNAPKTCLLFLQGINGNEPASFALGQST